jgi:predicted dehydrogenase
MTMHGAKKLRVGIVGAGLIGRKRGLAVNESSELVGIYDLDQSRAVALAEELGIKRFVTADDLVRAVGNEGLLIVAVPHSHLVKVGKIGLEQGCHLLLEKPGALNPEEFRELLDLASANDRIVRVGYNHRFHPSFKELSLISQSQIYGSIHLIRARYGHGGRRGYETEWRAQKEISGGGELIDQGSHLLDLVRFIGGEIEIEYADTPTLFWEMKVEDNAFIAGRINDSAKFWLHASWSEWKNLFSFEVFFKTAKIEITGLGGSYGRESLRIYFRKDGFGIPEVTDLGFPEEDLSWESEFNDVTAQIAGGAHIGSTGQDALVILEKIQEIYNK